MRRVRFTDPPPLPADEPAYSCPMLEEWYSAKQASSIARMQAHDAQPRFVRDMLNTIGYPDAVQGLLNAGYRDAESAEKAYLARCEQMRLQQEQQDTIEMQIERRTRRG